MLTLKAPAKVNLFLELIKKRADGYHELVTVFHAINLCDILRFKKTNDGKIKLTCSDKSLPLGDKNLVVKVAKLLQQKKNVKYGATIYLKKNIPSGAGLGGGSSDAATTLCALAKLWGTNSSISELHKIGAAIGADVPFFISPGTAVAKGIGDKLFQINKVTPAWFIVVSPSFGISTAMAYSKVKFPLTNIRKVNKIIAHIKAGRTLSSLNEALFNRFEEFVFDSFSELGDIKQKLSSFGCPSLMSGSGSCVFAIAASKSVAQKAKLKMQKYGYKIWIVSSFANK
ncbi:MAG: 4-(cytidine 5'-diphospho)-2-C-methyl-D-erythritol kinase [Endomicrobiales bacterium]|nr:4-(cytidine 5'-diphospho)-2-C-methyl-D-erythritol kinase [Endomicrobiales bacterium]